MPSADANVLHMRLVMVRADWQGNYHRYVSQGENKPPKRIEFPLKQPVALRPSELNDPAIQKALAKKILLPVEIDRETGHVRYADPATGEPQKLRFGDKPTKRTAARRKAKPAARKKSPPKQAPKPQKENPKSPPAGSPDGNKPSP